MFFKKNKTNLGFTLIEVIVVMGVFLFIIGVAISIFISVVQNQKKVLSEQQLISQISYVEEYMSKALRMAAVDNTANGSCVPKGYIYLLTDHDNDNQTFEGIRFFNQSSGDCQEFYIDNTADSLHPVLKELKGSEPGYRASNNDGAIAITSAGLKINYVKFSINGKDGTVAGQGCADNPTSCGASNADTVQPRVTMLFNIGVSNDNQATNVNCSPITVCPLGDMCDVSTHRCLTTTTVQTTVSQRNLNIK